MTINLNCDIGESYGHWKLGNDAAVMPHIDQANIACGFHAGDPLTAKQTINLALEHGVSMGAHPSYPDIVGFGRRSMACTSEELIAMVQYQVSALNGLAQSSGGKIEYVKPHGAMYNDMMRDESKLVDILNAVAELKLDLKLMILGTAQAEKHKQLAEGLGVQLIIEGFADRRYTDSGHLQSRNETGSVLNESEVLDQVKQICATGSVTSNSNKVLQIPIESLCVHGDNPNSCAAIKTIKHLIQHNH